ncbi:MAG TPA: TadE family protein [Candidatus Limnocylindria bacterium]|nr:TadE family protein [Candidatus Limnocylindria bacterium]
MNRAANPFRSAPRGQALVELAIVMPMLLAFAGIIVDFGRAYAAQIALESATRTAAEYAAGNATDEDSALTEARSHICGELESVIGYEQGDTPEACDQPEVEVLSYSRSSTAPGATAFYPLGSVTLQARLPFRMLMPWPWLDRGSWQLSATESFQVLQGR